MIRAVCIDAKCNSIPLGAVCEVENYKSMKVMLVGKSRIYDPSQFCYFDENNERITQDEVRRRFKRKI